MSTKITANQEDSVPLAKHHFGESGGKQNESRLVRTLSAHIAVEAKPKKPSLKDE